MLMPGPGNLDNVSIPTVDDRSFIPVFDPNALSLFERNLQAGSGKS